MKGPKAKPAGDVPGLAARRVAVEILDAVLRRRRALDGELGGKRANPGLAALDERDRALARRIVATVLRRLGTLRFLLLEFLERGLPADAPRVEMALLAGAAQVLWLDVPNHAAVDLAVRLVRADRRAARYAALANAVLRRIAKQGALRLEGLDTAVLDTPAWLMARWTLAYGEADARAIAKAHAVEAALDLTVKRDVEKWAATLNGRVLPTGTLRVLAHGRVSSLPGYDEGEWWVQDAAAAIPARLFGDVSGLAIADLCSAPGGKTAQLASAGARVAAIDRSPVRIERLRENLVRLKLDTETIVADAAEWQGGPFDGVLVDAPCMSTGTIRRHPDIAWLKQESDLAGLTALQGRLLDRAAALAKPGGLVVYCTCSLEPEEGEAQIEALLARNPTLRRRPIAPDEFPGLAGLISAAGDLRTLPCHWPAEEARFSGLDGFFAARLERI